MDSSLQTLVALIGALVSAGLVVRFWIAESRRSRLVDSSVFELPPAPEGAAIYEPNLVGVEHFLAGRELDVTHLSRVVQSSPLVFVVGDSGVGKSTLLKLGVARRLMRVGTWLPVYLDVWGSHWRLGPEQALRDALQVAVERGLEAAQRQQLGVDGAITTENLFDVLERLRATVGRRPVLMFDQLDDYLSGHGERLVSQEDRTVLSADHLARRNPFWGDLRRLLRAGALHAVFAVRSDVAGGLRSFWFEAPETPETFLVRRLAAVHVKTVVDHVMHEGAVSRPDNGFRQVVEVLAQELDAADSEGVLPIQLRVVLGGLTGLRPLTPGALRKAGGAGGLEAAYLEGRLSRGPGGKAAALSLLRRLMTGQHSGPPGSDIPNRDIPRSDIKTLDELVTASGDWAGASPETLQTLLRSLEREGLVRRRWDPEQGEVWSLYHDYLARAIVALDAKRRRWQTLLAGRAELFEGAQGWRKTGALLGPISLVRLFWERLRGRLRFAAHRRFVACSAPRLLFNAGVLWVLLAGLGYSWYRAEETGQDLARAFDVEDEVLDIQEVRALWGLAAASPSARQAALATFLESSVNGRRFLAHRDAILVALSGLDGERHERYVREVITPACLAETPEDSNLVASCVVLLSQFDGGDPQTAGRFAESVLAEDASPYSVAWLTHFTRQIDGGLEERILERVLETLRETRDETLLQSLYWSANTLAIDLGAPWPGRLAELWLARIADDEKSPFSFDRPKAGGYLIQIAGVADEATAPALAELLVTTLEDPQHHRSKPSVSDALHFATEALSALADRLPSSGVSDLAPRIVHAAEQLRRQIADDDLLASWGEEKILELDLLAVRFMAGANDAAARDWPLPWLKGIREDLERQMAKTSWHNPQLWCRLLVKLEEPLGADLLNRAALDIARRMEGVVADRSEDGLIFGSVTLADFAGALQILDGHVDPKILRRGASSALQMAIIGLGADLSEQWAKGSWSVESLASMAGHMPVDEVQTMVPRVFRQALEIGSEIPWEVSESLLLRLPRAPARRLAVAVLDTLESSPVEWRARPIDQWLNATFLGAARRLGEDSELLQQVVRRTRHLGRPPCAAAAALAGPNDTDVLLDLLKWPTCLPADRVALIQRWLELRGDDPASFTHRDGLATLGVADPARFWNFVDWAGQQTSEAGRRHIARPPENLFESGILGRSSREE